MPGRPEATNTRSGDLTCADAAFTGDGASALRCMPAKGVSGGGGEPYADWLDS